MKRTILIVLTAVWTMAHLEAQVTVTSADIAEIDDLIIQGRDTMPGAGIDPGSAGASQTWDFSTLVDHEIDTLRFLNSNWTPYYGDFPTSNIAIAQTDQGDTTYVYIESTVAGLYVQGYSGDLLGTGSPFSVKFQPKATIAQWPMNYQDTYSANDGSDFTVDGSFVASDSLRMKSFVSRTVNVDAWGTVTTALGPFDALRVYEMALQYDSTWVLSIAGTWTILSSDIDTSYTYTWWTDDNAAGFPLVTMEYDMDQGQAMSVEYLKATPTPSGISEHYGKSVQVYPNPASDFVIVDNANDNADRIELYDLQGRLISRSILVTASTTIDISGMESGMYIYRGVTIMNEPVFSGKLSILR